MEKWRFAEGIPKAAPKIIPILGFIKEEKREKKIVASSLSISGGLTYGNHPEV